LFYQSQSDETLVMLTLAGEQRAYEALVVRYQDAVLTSARLVTHNQFMAEDAAQDAFVSAWMKLNTLKEPKKFGSWVCRIAKNCSVNMVMRYRSFVSLDVVENLESVNDLQQNPEMRYASSDSEIELHKSIDRLPAKVKKIINLFYFEGYSVLEIAKKMSISEGTVKWQLSEGRKRIRKDLGAMDERENDTLLQKVMKKVEELKLWRLKSSKSGFESVYEAVLSEAEELPESSDKHHAIADMLMCGWWWIPGQKNDALFTRMKECAAAGKNEEVMDFVMTREISNIWNLDEKIHIIHEHQIPELEKNGFVKTLAKRWYTLGHIYCQNNQLEKGIEAYNKALEYLKPCDSLYTLVPEAIAVWNKFYAEKDLHKDEKEFRLDINAVELRRIDGELRFWNEDYSYHGWTQSVDDAVYDIFNNASACDKYFTIGNIEVGGTHIGSDGIKLTFVSGCETVETPCGIFDGCQLWEVTLTNSSVFRSYYKSGIGIVKHEHSVEGITEARVLKSYHIEGGEGLIPLAAGNTWEYTGEYAPEFVKAEIKYSVSYADDKSAILTLTNNVVRMSYDENSWLDMVQQIRNEYFRNGELYDMSHAAERAEALAKTPIEKAHAKVAGAVVKRIYCTCPAYNPDHTATGHWNFFNKLSVRKENGFTKVLNNFRWSFELKNMTGEYSGSPLLYNDIYGILVDGAGCLWSDEWKDGTTTEIETKLYEYDVKTSIVCESCGCIVTKAGTFENCLKVTLNIKGLTNGMAYRGDIKEYYFAPGIGIVRTVSEYKAYGKPGKAVYELTSYEGTGEGYMPVSGGMFRRYDALNLKDGYVGAAEYTYAENDDGELAIFADKIGIRETRAVVTRYSLVENEIIEKQLWEKGKHDESRRLHDLNNFSILTHFLGRENRYCAMPERAVNWHKYRINIIEGLGENGEIPEAWLGLYAELCFRCSCALFGCGKKEEGYEYLERALELDKKYNSIPDGTALDVGMPMIYGDIKLIKGTDEMVLPDGTKETTPYYVELFRYWDGFMHWAMTVEKGWEWFDSVRDEAKFKEYIERAKNQIEVK